MEQDIELLIQMKLKNYELKLRRQYATQTLGTTDEAFLKRKMNIQSEIKSANVLLRKKHIQQGPRYNELLEKRNFKKKELERIIIAHDQELIDKLLRN